MAMLNDNNITQTADNKNYLVEIYRFAIAISIALFHYFKIDSNNNNLRLGVEFFFVLSGYLLVESIDYHPNKSANSVVFSKIMKIYPSVFATLTLAVILETIAKSRNFFSVLSKNFHSYLFITNLFYKKTTWISGTGQLWFIPAQIIACFLLSYFIKYKRNLLINCLLFLFVVGGYTIEVRCAGNINCAQEIKFLSGKLWFPLLYIRAIAGMSVGIAANVVKKSIFDKYTYTTFGKKAGITLSIVCLTAGLTLSSLHKSMPINSHGWRSIIVVFLYGVSIALAFSFAKFISFSAFAKRAFNIMGKQAMNIYMVHMLIIVIMTNSLDLSTFQVKHVAIFLVLTLVSAIVFGYIVDIGSTVFRKIIKKLRELCISNEV